MTQENKPFGLQTEPLEAMVYQFVWMLLTSLWRWVGMLMFPRKKDSDRALSWR